MTQKNRIYWMDALRGFCMLGIFWGHASITFIKGLYINWPVQDIYASRLYVNGGLYYQSLLPALFFVISGYFAYQSIAKVNIWQFFINRIKRLTPTFIIGVFIMVLPAQAIIAIPQLFPETWWQSQNGLSSQVILNNMHKKLSAIGYGHVFMDYFNNTQIFWFLYYLLLISIFFVLLYFVFNIKKINFLKKIIIYHLEKSGPWLPILLAILTSLITQPPQHLYMDTPFSYIPKLNAVLFFLLMFVCGVSFKALPNCLEKAKCYWLYYLGLGVIIVFPIYVYLFTHQVNYTTWEFKLIIWLIHNLFVWLTIFGIIGACALGLTIPNKMCRYLSDASYWIYFIHLPLVIYLQSQFAHNTWLLPFKCMSIIFIATIIVLLSYEIMIRRTPLRKIFVV